MEWGRKTLKNKGGQQRKKGGCSRFVRRSEAIARVVATLSLITPLFCVSLLQQIAKSFFNGA
jgi:hypothetical protein